MLAAITTEDGFAPAPASHDFDVFPATALAPPHARIAVLDPSNSLKPFLKGRGIGFEEFTKETDPAVPVFVSRTRAAGPAQARRFHELTKFIRAGGTGVYLEGGGLNAPWGLAGKASPLLPCPARTKQSIGLWNGISHIVKDHPVFEGLPVNQSMGAIYGNVWARNTLESFDGETIAGSIGYDWFPDFDLAKRHYQGPGETWWGADLGVAHHGKGRCIASQLHLLDHLGTDPVADKILFNMIRWTAE